MGQIIKNKMWQDIVDLAVKNGLWAVLFLCLLIYVLKDSKVRENKYQETIKDLSISLKVVNEIKEEVNEIKQTLSSQVKEETEDNEF